MANQYFRVIQTINTEAKDAAVNHEQKLNNYLKYGWPETNSNLIKDMPALTYKKKVVSQSTATAMKDHTFIITTTLCCEDETFAEQKIEDYKG